MKVELAELVGESREWPYPAKRVFDDATRLAESLDRLNNAIDSRDSPNARRAQGLAGDLLRHFAASHGLEIRPQISEIMEDTAARIRGKTEVPSEGIRSDGTAVLLVAGQSNATNEGGGAYRPIRPVINWNVIDDKFYDAWDPLLGTTGEGGNFCTRLADHLIASGRYERVVLANVAVGGTYVHDWTPTGRLHGRLLAAIDRLAARNLPITHMLWHQGEADGALKTEAEEYRDRFLSMARSLRKHGLAAPIFVAVATYCYGSPDPVIRGSQKALVDGKTILAGPDTDRLGDEFRLDRCHLNERGIKRHAEMWFDILMNSQSNASALESKPDQR